VPSVQDFISGVLLFLELINYKYKERKKMKQQLLSIWKDVSQLEDLDPTKSIFELGLDSIQVIDISEQVYSKMGIRLEWEEFNVVSTFNETLEILKEKQHSLAEA